MIILFAHGSKHSKGVMILFNKPSLNVDILEITVDKMTHHDSDHSPVNISLTSEDQSAPRGPGFWKFNNSLLQNEEFVTKLKSLIQNAKEKYKKVTDKRLFWEMIKMEIRIFSIRFAKRKAKEKRHIELLRKIQDLNARIDTAPAGNPLANEAKKFKIKLDQMAEEKTRGFIIRSRPRWNESQEKCNKYFLNLSKRSYNKRYIKEIEILRRVYYRGFENHLE